MLIEQITPMLITFNEESNLGRALERLDWARRILIVDSGSTDASLIIASKNPRVEIVHREFDSFAGQCNFGLSQIQSDWVLSMDADYELSAEFVDEISRLKPDQSIAGYAASFVYRIYGRPLRASLYPPRVVLYQVTKAKYRDEGHGHRVSLHGEVRDLRNPIYHDDRKPLKRWLKTQLRYAEREAEYLIQAPDAELSRVDRVRKAGWPAPILVFAYVLFAKRAILDGWAGWFYALQRLLAEVLIALELADRRLRPRPTGATSS